MHAKRGIRLERNGITFRSKWEHNLSLVLDYMVDKGILISWQYEPKTYFFAHWYGTLLRPGPMTYLPDFYCKWADGHENYVEVKGYSQGTDRTKLRRFIKHYNTHPLILVTDDASMLKFAETEGLEVWRYRALTKQYRPLLDEWRC